MRCGPCGPGPDDEEMDAEEEAVVHKSVADPGQPSKKDRLEHELTHMPYRSWCEHCVRGRGKSKPHFRRDEDEDVEDRLPTIAMEYCFQKKRPVEESRQEKMITTLVLTESPTGAMV